MSKQSPIPDDISSSKKIGGYNSWEVTSAIRKLRDAEKIVKDATFLKVVLLEMDKEADRTAATAKAIRKTRESYGAAKKVGGM